MSAPRATRVALLTAPGRGAIATLFVRGPAAIAAVARYFLPATGVSLNAEPISQTINRPRFGRWNGPGGEELIVCALDSESVEIHCHGGVAAADAITAMLVAAGCEPAGSQDADLFDEPDPICRAARRMLALAPTERCAAILLDQHAGALGGQLQFALEAIDAGNAARASAIIAELLAAARLGLHLVEPFRVVLVGPPNVGKSSLINALMGFERAIVHSQPGTTRDAVTATTAIDGWPVELIDTAGLHAASDRLELAGIARARAHADSADLVVVVVDRSRGASEADRAACAGWTKVLAVQNKCDLPPANVACELRADCLTSAATGQGIDVLVQAIANRLVPSSPAPGTAMPFTGEQVHALEIAAENLRAGNLAACASSLASLLAQQSDSVSRDVQ